MSDNVPHGKRKLGTLKNGNRSGDPSQSPRCGARTRKGGSCLCPAMKNGRCRLHGGLSTGPKTLEGQERSRIGNWKHGWYSAEAKAERRYLTRLVKRSKEYNLK